MSSCPKCTPPAAPPSASTPAPASAPTPHDPEPWNELSAIRETALRHFTRPEDEACLRRLGELLHESALEQAHLWPVSADSETASGVRAAHRDLLHTLQVLRSLGDGRHLSALPPGERALAALASRTARHLRRVAEHLRSGLERHAGDARVH